MMLNITSQKLVNEMVRIATQERPRTCCNVDVLITTRPKLKTFDEFEQDIRDGYYDRVKMCLSLKSLIKVLEMFPNHRAELIDMFNYSMSELVNENLWK